MGLKKEELLKHICTTIETQIHELRLEIDSILQEMGNETKSSAGDKHETGRAMLQLEREKLGQQLYEAEKVKLLLRNIKIDNDFTKAGLGNLVYTSKNTYFIAISAGEFENNNTSIYCISAQTPVGKLLMGSSVGDQISFRGEIFVIRKIL